VIFPKRYCFPAPLLPPLGLREEERSGKGKPSGCRARVRAGAPLVTRSFRRLFTLVPHHAYTLVVHLCRAPDPVRNVCAHVPVAVAVLLMLLQIRRILWTCERWCHKSFLVNHELLQPE